MKYRTIGTDPATRRNVSALCLGAMLFGTGTDEKTSFAVLDRFVEAGGTFIDTANNYSWWPAGNLGGQSEELLGKWLRGSGAADRVVIATKLGARPVPPVTGFPGKREGLSAAAVRAAAEGSLERLGVERLDLLYTHIEDQAVPVEETVGALGELVAEGKAGLLGVSNHATWRVERARSAAASAGTAGYEVLQYDHSYLRPRTDVPHWLFPDGYVYPGSELFGYMRAEPGLTLVAYSPLLKGAYTRSDKTLPAEYDHPGTLTRMAALREVAAETGATLNQVVLAWQMGHEPPIIPLVGVSSLEQLEENLGGAALELTAGQRAKLDAAH